MQKQTSKDAIIFSPHLQRESNSLRPVSVVPSNNQVYMFEELDFQIPSAFDPFALGTEENIHIRIRQRNGKKSLTTVQGLKKECGYENILKDFKKAFCCNGNVVENKELGKIIQLQGDQRKKVSQYLVQTGIANKDQIKIHGF